MKVSKLKKPAFAAAGIIVYLLFAFILKAPAELAACAENVGSTGAQAMSIIGALLFAVCWWVGGVIPDWATSIIMLCLWILVSKAEFQQSFAMYSNSTIWMFVGAFPISAAVTRSGLLRRISLKLMKLFPMSFSGQVLAVLSVGTICNPLVPSAAAKGVLGASIAKSTSETLGYESGSKQRAGLFIASWTGFGVMAVAFINASVPAFTVRSCMPADVAAKLTWLNWFIAMLPWLVIVFALMFVLIWLFFRPKKGEAKLGKDELNQQIANLPPMSRQEKISGLILCFCLLMWIFESVTGVNSTVVALIGMLLCYITKILDFDDFKTCVPWTMIIFTGAVMVIGNMFSISGVNDWLQILLAPFFSKLTNPVLLFIVIVLVVNVVRMFVATLGGIIVIFMAVLTPVITPMGISPFIVAMVVFASSQCWYTTYQNGLYLPAFEAMGGTVKQKHSALGSLAFEVVSLIACIISIPFWQMLGYIA